MTAPEVGLPIETIDGEEYRIQQDAFTHSKFDAASRLIMLRILIRDCVEIATHIFDPSLNHRQLPRLDVAIDQKPEAHAIHVAFVRVPGVTGWIRTLDE